MKTRLNFRNADTYEANKKMNELLIELEIAEFRVRSMIDYHEAKKRYTNKDLRELHEYMIDFYNDLLGEIKQRRVNI